MKINKNPFSVILFLFSTNIFCAQATTTVFGIERTFNVTTKIDLINLFPYSLNLFANPNSLELEYNKKSLMFNDEIVELTTQSNIPIEPETEFLNYNMILFENTSVCKSFSGDLEGASDFIDLFIKGSNIVSYTEINMSKPIENVNFNSAVGDAYQTGHLSLKLNQNEPFNKDVYLTKHCSGKIILGVELSL